MAKEPKQDEEDKKGQRDPNEPNPPPEGGDPVHDRPPGGWDEEPGQPGVKKKPPEEDAGQAGA